jgi:hypothetical protein
VGKEGRTMSGVELVFILFVGASLVGAVRAAMPR